MQPTMWTIRTVLEDFDLKYVYEHYPNLITLKIHHGGFFTKRPGRKYIEGKTTHVDLVDVDELSVHEIDAMVKELGYTGNYPMYYHFLTPDSDLDIGLRALGSDQDIINLINYSSTHKLIEVYIEHIRTTVHTYNKSPGGPKVVIEEIPDDSPLQITHPRKKGSSSCKKKLFLEWKATEEYTPVEDSESWLGQKAGIDESVLESGLGLDLNEQSYEFDPFWEEHGIDQPSSVQQPPVH